MNDILKLINNNELIDYCALRLIEKQKNKCNEKSKILDPLLIYYEDINAEILCKSYMGLLNYNNSKILIKDSSNINDLKSIVFIDSLAPFINKDYSESVINSELNVHEKAIEFAKIYTSFKQTKKIEKLFLDDNLLTEDIYLLGDIKNYISTKLQPCFNSKDNPCCQENYLHQFLNLTDKKMIDGLNILIKNISYIEQRYKLNKNNKNSYLGCFSRKKGYEYAKSQLIDYRKMFNKIKELIEI